MRKASSMLIDILSLKIPDGILRHNHLKFYVHIHLVEIDSILTLLTYK